MSAKDAKDGEEGRLEIGDIQLCLWVSWAVSRLNTALSVDAPLID